MTVKKTRAAYIFLPGRQWLGRATVALLVTSSIVLLTMNKTGNPAAVRLRSNITDIMAPVLAVASSPLDAMHDAGTWFQEMSQLRERNLILEQQNQQLLKWQAAAQEMQSENTALHNLMNVVPSQKSSYVTARLVSDVSGPYVHSALINGGIANGIKQDQAVINDKGLLGRVISVGNNSARILLLSDINSRVPVVTEHTQEKGILAGNNTDFPTLAYLPTTSEITVGERIVTSGDGGIFPAGIAVGVVTSVKGGAIKVQLFSDVAKAKYVSIVDYAF
jgi:rod shape-determining protein MreC